MHDILTLIFTLAAGVALGAVFFGGLWWTIRKGLGSKRPALWFFGSLLLRTGIVLIGFYVVIAGGHWERLLACLLGFVIARLIVTRLAGSPVEHDNSLIEEDKTVDLSRGAAVPELTPQPPLLKREGEQEASGGHPCLLPLSSQERGPGGEFFLTSTVLAKEAGHAS